MKLFVHEDIYEGGRFPDNGIVAYGDIESPCKEDYLVISIPWFKGKVANPFFDEIKIAPRMLRFASIVRHGPCCKHGGMPHYDNYLWIQEQC